MLNEHFKKYGDKLSFIQLKDNRELNIEGYKIDDTTPLPVLVEDLVREIKDGNLEEEIRMTNIIDGIIFTLGMDDEFKYLEEYKEILASYQEGIEEYIFFKGIRHFEKQDYDRAAIAFRALKIVDPANTNGIFNYALSLEAIAKKFFKAEEDVKGLEFINVSTDELESILEIDDKYPLAYYKLGYHYKFNGQYLKAKLIWNKYLQLDKDDLRLQEIRVELEGIEEDVILESGITYLSKGYFEKALDEFLKILPKFKEWWELNYFLGLSYKGLGEYNESIKHFEIALEDNNKVAEIYNEMGITYMTIDKLEEAIGVFTEGIEEIENDYKLFFNRGIAYLQLEDIRSGYEDIKRAVEINPEDENMLLQKQKIEELL